MNLISKITATVMLLVCSAGWRITFGQTFSFIHNDTLRSYILHLPPSYSPVNLYPLVLNLHGLTTTASFQQSYTQFDAVADTGNFIVVYPDGINTSWNAGLTNNYNPGIDDVGFLSTLIDTISANYSIDSARIYSTGMSMGGFMSYRLACELENRIAAIASVTGLMSDSVYDLCQPSRPIPVLQMHGTTDVVVSYNGAPAYASVDSTIGFWVNNNGCSSTPAVINLPDNVTGDGCTVTKYEYGSGQDSTEVVLYKIINGGHTWPGAIPGGVGNTNQDIDASGEIWNFFRKHYLKISTPSAICDCPVQLNNLRISPNPFTDAIIVEIPPEAEELEIYNILGLRVLNHSLTGYSTTIKLNKLGSIPKGIYLIKVRGKDYIKTFKMIKQ